MSRRPRGREWIAAAAALLALACSGCGFKGPLYLPARNPTVVTHPAQAAQGSQQQGQSPAAKTKGKTSPPAPQTSPSQNPPPASPPESSPP
jgi:predicted small lipoprotein YifL